MAAKCLAIDLTDSGWPKTIDSISTACDDQSNCNINTKYRSYRCRPPLEDCPDSRHFRKHDIKYIRKIHTTHMLDYQYNIDRKVQHILHVCLAIYPTILCIDRHILFLHMCMLNNLPYLNIEGVLYKVLSLSHHVI